MSNKYSFNVNKSFVIKSWDSDMEKLSQKSADDVIGSKVSDILPALHGEIAPVFKDARKKSVRNFKNTCFLCTDMAADISVAPIKDRKGNVREARISLDNISGRCPLTQKLTDAEKMVAIGKVASSLAHGVRNPLNAIKGAVVYLREKYGHEATLQEFSTIIYDEINKLDSFISSFLSTSMGQISFAPIDINDVLKSIFTMSIPRAETQKVAMTHEFSVLPVIEADAFQIEQAVFNIVNNALEAMPDGGAINMKTSLKWESGEDYALIEVSDTGKGISEKELSKLGEISGSSKDDDRGFGIFLSREIIKSHNGKLLWESIRGRGTVFKILLPVKQIERP